MRVSVGQMRRRVTLPNPGFGVRIPNSRRTGDLVHRLERMPTDRVNKCCAWLARHLCEVH